MIGVGCSSAFFYPDRHQRLEPDEIGLTFEDVHFSSEGGDGVMLHGWLLHPRPKAHPARGTVLFLHGNAENISTHIRSVHWLPAEGFRVFLFDYRGYGLSEGRSTIASVHRDAEAALRTLLARDDVDSRRLVVFGQSFGAAVALSTVARLQGEVEIRALVLDSAFSEFRGIAREKLSAHWLTWALQWPLSLTVPNRPNPLDAIASLKAIPVLLIHGEADRVVPLHHSQRLQAAAAVPASLWIAPGAGHIEALRDPRWRERLLAFLDGALSREDRPAGEASDPTRPPPGVSSMLVHPASEGESARSSKGKPRVVQASMPPSSGRTRPIPLRCSLSASRALEASFGQVQ